METLIKVQYKEDLDIHHHSSHFPRSSAIGTIEERIRASVHRDDIKGCNLLQGKCFLTGVIPSNAHLRSDHKGPGHINIPTSIMLHQQRYYCNARLIPPKLSYCRNSAIFIQTMFTQTPLFQVAYLQLEECCLKLGKKASDRTRFNYSHNK